MDKMQASRDKNISSLKAGKRDLTSFNGRSIFKSSFRGSSYQSNTAPDLKQDKK